MSLDDGSLAKTGYRLRGTYLQEQAHATLKLIARDRSRLVAEELLDPAEETEAQGLLTQVKAGLGDRAVREADARTGTESQNDHVRALKVLRRRLTKIAHRALRGTAELSEFQRGAARGDSVPALLEDMRRKVKIAQDKSALFAKKGGTPKFLAKVEQAIADLTATDATQETALKSLPKAFRDFCLVKAKLHARLKDLNDAGQALHADDPVGAAEYNLRILYRTAAPAKSKKEGAASPTK